MKRIIVANLLLMVATIAQGQLKVSASSAFGTTTNVPLVFDVNNVKSGSTGSASISSVSFGYEMVIKFELPDNVASAYIYIFNMQGALVKQIPINANQASITINGSELTASMYLYSLIVNGQEIDTKRMILTK